MSIRLFKEIEDWQLAREPTRPVYRVAMRKSFAKDFGLRDQIARAGEFDSTYHQAAHTRAKVGGFIRYLLQTSAAR